MAMALPEEHRAERLCIRGRVQGVWFRGWAVDQATRLGISGWVRNRRDGSVEVLVVGPEAAVEAMVHACRSGPPAARVETVERAPAEGITGRGFVQKPTV